MHEHASFSQQLLCEELDKRRASFDTLAASSQQHLFGEDSTVQQHKASVASISQRWEELNQGVIELQLTMQPWKGLTDQFDTLSNWFSDFEERVHNDLSAIEGVEYTAAGADLSDTVVQVKDHILKLDQQTPGLELLKKAMAEVLIEAICAEFPASKELSMNCKELVEQQQLLRRELELALHDVEQKVRVCLAAWHQKLTLYLIQNRYHSLSSQAQYKARRPRIVS